MIAPLVALCLASANSDGVVRVLDQKSRTYAVHLAVTENSSSFVSDYDLVLNRATPPKRQKGLKDEKPPTHLLFLTNLNYRSREYTRKEASFGAGKITFGVDGTPSGVINPGWTLCPLLSFYVPGAEGRVLTDIPVALDDLGGGWQMTGTARMALANVEGQEIDIDGKMTGKAGSTMTFSSQATMDVNTGWPIKAKGTIQGVTATISYTVTLKT